MAKHITDKDIEKIVGIIDGWIDKLTWEALCDACLPSIGVKPTRQTLMKFVRIKQAFEVCKKRIKEDVPAMPVPSTIKVAAERIARLERENDRLKLENAALLEQFVVWQYNAHVHGLGGHELNKSLSRIDRGNTDL